LDFCLAGIRQIWVFVGLACVRQFCDFLFGQPTPDLGYLFWLGKVKQKSQNWRTQAKPKKPNLAYATTQKSKIWRTQAKQKITIWCTQTKQKIQNLAYAGQTKIKNLAYAGQTKIPNLKYAGQAKIQKSKKLNIYTYTYIQKTVPTMTANMCKTTGVIHCWGSSNIQRMPDTQNT